MFRKTEGNVILTPSSNTFLGTVELDYWILHFKEPGKPCSNHNNNRQQTSAGAPVGGPQRGRGVTADERPVVKAVL